MQSVYCELGTEFIPFIYVNFVLHIAVPSSRRSVAGLSPRRTGFDPRLVHVRSVVFRVALGQVHLRGFLHQYHFTTGLLHTHLHLHVVLFLLQGFKRGSLKNKTLKKLGSLEMAGRLHKISSLDIYIYHKVFYIILVPSSSTGFIKVKNTTHLLPNNSCHRPKFLTAHFYKEFNTAYLLGLPAFTQCTQLVSQLYTTATNTTRYVLFATYPPPITHTTCTQTYPSLTPARPYPSTPHAIPYHTGPLTNTATPPQP
jgi:hypothetical protein